jgi:hypothetical protein
VLQEDRPKKGYELDRKRSTLWITAASRLPGISHRVALTVNDEKAGHTRLFYGLLAIIVSYKSPLLLTQQQVKSRRGQ